MPTAVRAGKFDSVIFSALGVREGYLYGLLPEDEQNIVRAKVKSIIESDLLLSDRDTIEFPYVTELHLFRKQD